MSKKGRRLRGEESVLSPTDNQLYYRFYLFFHVLIQLFYRIRYNPIINQKQRLPAKSL